MPRKAIKACPGRGRDVLSHSESGHAVPFLRRTSAVPVNLFTAATTHGPHWSESTSSQNGNPFEREEISDHQLDSGNYDRVADGDWENCVRSQGA